MSLPLNIEMQLAELSTAFENKLPDYRSKLMTIHNALKADPDTVTLLSDEQIGLIIKGLITFSGEDLVEKAIKPAKGRAAKIAIDDLGL